MKKFPKILLSILIVCLAASLCLIAACNDTAKATLTLDVGDGGTLSQTEIEVNVGDKIYDAVKDSIPATESGVTFAGWFKDGQPLTENDVMPEGGLTLAAKYDVTYTVNVYYSAKDNSFPETPSQTTTGTARLGEAFTLDVSPFEARGLLLTNQSRVHSDALGKNEVFVVYISSDIVRVNYNVNRDGDAKSIASVDVARGEKVTLADGNEFGLERDVRFAGWSTKPDGELEYAAGDEYDTIKMSGYNVTMYAVWQEPLVDVFGGDDYLFVSLTKQDEVYLRRQGLEEKTGSYDVNTGVFVFKDGERSVLDGKIDGNRFYYFEKLAGRSARNGLDNGETIVFNGSNNLSYSSQGITVDGTFDMNFVTGEYVFLSDDLTFHFTLNTMLGELVFNRTNSKEAGFYYFAANNSVLYLDGMIDENGIGGMTLYTVTDNELVAVVKAFYYEWEDLVIVGDAEQDYYKFEETTYVAISSASTPMFLFRTEDNAADSKYGVEIRGKYLVSDGLEGHYFNDVMNEEPNLLLDGFGNLLIKPEGAEDYVEGTYTIQTRVLQMLEYGVLNDWQDLWLEITVNGKTTYEALWDNILPQHTAIEQAPRMTRWAQNNPASKVYGGAPQYDSMWVYETALYGAFIMGLTRNEDVGDYYETMDNGIITQNSDGTYRFTSGLYTDETSFWDFRYLEDGTIETSVLGAEGYTIGSEDFSMDKWGTLTYNGKKYNFGEWGLSSMSSLSYGNSNTGFYLEFYEIPGNTEEQSEETTEDIVIPVHVQTTRTGQGDATVTTYDRKIISKDAVMDLVWKTFYGQNENFDKLYFMDDTHAAIGLLAEDLVYYFMIYGTLSYDEALDEYSFDIDDSMKDVYIEAVGYEYLVEAFAHFKFKLERRDDVLFATKFDDKTVYTSKNGDRFDIDGYGNATYTPAGGEAIEGTYEAIDFYKKYFFEFTSLDGETTHFVTVIYENDKATDFLVDADGAGVYYNWIQGTIYRDYYIIMLGDGAESNSGTILFDDAIGTYKATGNNDIKFYDSSLQWTEYEIKWIVENSASKPITHIISSTASFSAENSPSSTEYKVYLVRMDPQADREFDVVGGGKIFGDGYNDSYYFDGQTYYFGVLGIGVMKDRSPLEIDYDWDDDFENGTQLVFRADYSITNGQTVVGSSEFLFDIGSDGKLTLRDNYNATYAFYDKGNITQTEMYLDGHGKAFIYDENDNELDSGTYSYNRGLDCMLFTSERDGGRNFRFHTATMSFSDNVWFVYYVIEDETVFVGEDWSVLLLGSIRNDSTFGYINGMYVDGRGNINGGFYSRLGDDVVRFEFDNGSYGFYNLEGNNFTVNNETFIIRDHTLVAYQGPSTVNDLVIPDEVTAIGGNAFANVYRLGGRTLDLNNVERIEAYAFFGIHNFAVTTISSEKVIYVGNYAFYCPYTLDNSSTDDIPTFNIIDVNFPNATYIGDYAFNGCNQMNVGTVKLNKVEYIGYSAFSHNIFSSGEKMILDLTEANVSAIKMDRNAFLPGPNTDLPGLPVIIYVRDQASYDATAAWYEEIHKCVEIKTISVEGMGFFDFETRDYLLLGEYEDGIGSISYYTYGEDGYVLQSNAGGYTFVDYGVVQLTLGEKQYTFNYKESVIEIGSNLFYKNNVPQTFTVTDESGAEVEFTFRYDMEINQDGIYSTVNMNLSGVYYDGQVASTAIVSFEDYTCQVNYSIGEEIYNVTIDLSNWSAEATANGKIVYTSDGSYRADLENLIADGYQYMTLYVRETDGTYSPILEGVRRSDLNVWIGRNRASDGNTEMEITYTVTYDPKTELINVTTSIHRLLTLQTSDGKYRVVFSYSVRSEMDEIVSLAQWNADSNQFEYIYNLYDFNFGFELSKDGTNIFTVVRNANGQLVWRIQYIPASGSTQEQLIVTFSNTSVERVESVHEDSDETGVHEDYYDLALLVDAEGNVVGIEEMRRWTYSGQDYKEDMVWTYPQNVQNQGNGVFAVKLNNKNLIVTVKYGTDDSGQRIYLVTVVEA